MKRLFYGAGFVLTLAVFGSCAQHDPSSPDTSGNMPKTQQGVGVDTSNVSAGAQSTSGPNGTNNSNDNTNNNQQVNTGDTGMKKQ